MLMHEGCAELGRINRAASSLNLGHVRKKETRKYTKKQQLAISNWQLAKPRAKLHLSCRFFADVRRSKSLTANQYK